MPSKFPGTVCRFNVHNNHHAIFCDSCHNWTHLYGALLVPYTRTYSIILGMYSCFFMANTFLPLARLFFSGATFFSLARLFFYWRDFFFHWCDFFSPARLFFRRRDFFSPARLLWRSFVDRC